MDAHRSFAIQSLVVTLIFNTFLLVAVYLFGGPELQDRALGIFGLGLLFSLGLWFIVYLSARRLADRAAAAQPAPAPAAPSAPAAPKQPEAPYETSALHLLGILQRKGRLIDFLQEDIEAYQDAQIGAAVRQVHAGCRQALAEYVALEPVMSETEGSRVTIQPGFDTHAVRLTGEVTGEPPFKGTLQHRGWRVKQVDLPVRTSDAADVRVIAAAEVEVA